MSGLAAVLVATVSNLDNLAAGVAFGIRGTRIGTTANLIIAAVTMAGTAGAMMSGHQLARLIAPSVASAVGSSIIIAIGVATVLGALRAVRAPIRPGTRPASAVGGSEVISLREALALGVALSVNNVGSGVGAGVAGIPSLATTLLAGAFSLLCVGGGSLVGRSAARLVLGGRAPLVAGLLLVGLGTATLAGLR